MNTITDPALAATAQAGELLSSLEPLQRAFLADPCPAWSIRAARLKALIRLLHENRERIADAISADFGHRSRHETDLLEVFPSLEGLRHALRHGKSWMRERRQPVSMWFQPGSAAVLPQPLGVVGIIVPWNYPLFLLMGPLASALAAGNLAMVKLSEYTPRFGALMAELLPEALGRDVVSVVNGGPDVAAAFSALPFGHLLFTGSTVVGKRVMAAAAEHLVPVTLELGGKCPAIVSAETCADPSRFAHAVRRIITGKVLNAGQTCIAPDYVLLPAAAVPRFIAVAREVLKKQYPEGAAAADYTGIANERHHDRLKVLLAEAQAAGAQSTPVMAAAAAGQRKLPLTVLSDCPEDTRALQEEIFGPVLPLVACETLDAAVAYVNARPHPLALYLFDDSRQRQEQVLRSTIAGGVSVNETLMHIAQDSLPFGGVGASGMGHYHGRYGFDTMSKLKPIFRQARFNGIGLLAPPYGKLFDRMRRLMLGS